MSCLWLSLNLRKQKVTTPDRVYETWKDEEGLGTYQPTLDIDGPPLFPVVEHSEGLVGIPLTKVPTQVPNGKVLVPIAVPKDVDNNTFKRVVSAAFQVFLQTGNFDGGKIAQLAGLPRATVDFVSATEEFNYALACRGVDTQGRGTITPQQDLALMVLSDIGSKKSWGARLKEAGISQATFTAWMKNPAFARRWNELSEGVLSNYGVALVELGRKAGEGDMQAIKLQLAASGRFSESQQAQIDVMAAMNRILEILAKHLADHPEIMQAVAQDLSSVVETSQRRVLEL